MNLLLYIFICSLYVIASTLGISKLRGPLRGANNFVYFLIFSTVVQIYQCVNSFFWLPTFYLYHFFHLFAMWFLLNQYMQWGASARELKQMGLIVSAGFVVNSLIVPFDQIPVTGIIIIDITIAYQSSLFIYHKLINRENDYKLTISLALGAYYSFEAMSMLLIKFEGLVVPWMLNVIALALMLIVVSYAIYEAGDKR